MAQHLPADELRAAVARLANPVRMPGVIQVPADCIVDDYPEIAAVLVRWLADEASNVDATLGRVETSNTEAALAIARLLLVRDT